MRYKRTRQLRYPGLRRGCIGDWATFLGPTGPMLFDRSGYGNTGMANGYGSSTGTGTYPDWVVSGAGYALDFDSLSQRDRVLFPESPLFNISSGTMCLWTKTAGSGTSFRGIFVKENAYSIFSIDNYLGYFNWGTTVTVKTSVLLTDNLWHHITLTFNDGLGGVNMYFDGRKVLSNSNLNIQDQIGRLRLGVNTDSFIQTFTGKIDSPMLFNRILSEKEIKLLASRRGIAYEVVPDRRSNAQVSAAISLNSNNLMMGTYL